MISERLREEGALLALQPELGDAFREGTRIFAAADVIDYLVAALEAAQHELKAGGCDPLHVCGMIDAALALARRK